MLIIYYYNDNMKFDNTMILIQKAYQSQSNELCPSLSKDAIVTLAGLYKDHNVKPKPTPKTEVVEFNLYPSYNEISDW